MKKIQYGILSTATIVPRFVKAVQNTNHSEVLAIASRSQNKADALAKELNIERAYGSYQQLYDDPEIDIIYIATINENHYQDMMDALNHGKHVVCEKPFTLTTQQAREVFELAKAKNLFLMEAQKSVFLPVTLQIKEYIDQQKLGKLLQVEMSSSHTGKHSDGHWMLDQHQGGAWIPSATYTIEYLDFLIGSKPDDYQAQLTLMETKAIDEVSINLRYQNVLAHSFISVKTATKNTATFYFEEGYIEVFEFWKARGYTVHHWKTKEENYVSLPVDYEMIYEVNHIHECLSNNLITSPVMSPEMTINCVELVEAVYQQSLV